MVSISVCSYIPNCGHRTLCSIDDVLSMNIHTMFGIILLHLYIFGCKKHVLLSISEIG